MLDVGCDISVEWVDCDSHPTTVLVYRNGAQVACLSVESASDMWDKLFSMFPETSPF